MVQLLFFQGCHHCWLSESLWNFTSGVIIIFGFQSLIKGFQILDVSSPRRLHVQEKVTKSFISCFPWCCLDLICENAVSWSLVHLKWIAGTSFSIRILSQKELWLLGGKKWLLQWFSYFHMKLGRRKVAFAWGFTKNDKHWRVLEWETVAKVTHTEATTLHALWGK